jgi:hypothetical protein
MPRLLDIRDEEGSFYIVIVSQSTVANGILVVVLWLSWRDYCVSTKLEPHLVGDLGLGNGVTSDEWNPP